MKYKIFLFFFSLFFFGCKKETQLFDKEWIIISDRISYFNGNQYFEFKSGKFSYKIPKNRLPFKKIMLLNSSLTGYFLELGAENSIIGIANPEYVYSEKMKNLISNGKIQNIGNDQKYNLEKILSLKPDAIFTNYIESFENSYEILKKNNIEVIFIDEYMEQNPLDKSEIIVLVGSLIGKEKEAKEIYQNIENQYNTLKNKAIQQKNKPIVLANEMYGNQWFMPGGKTFVARYLADAGANYILKENTSTTSVPMSFEEVFVKSEKASFWVNVGNYQKKSDLLHINPNYAKINAYKNGKIYSLSKAYKGFANDIFESGAVRADIVLKDYVKIFHPTLVPDYQTTYIKELK